MTSRLRGRDVLYYQFLMPYLCTKKYQKPT
nr:MAG TPA: hypothetical protein [Caudoviricetes sp.]